MRRRSSIKKIIDSLSEKEVRALLFDAAHHSSWVADRLAAVNPKADQESADFLFSRCEQKVRDAFNSENDESNADYYQNYDFYDTCNAIKDEVRILLESGLDKLALRLADDTKQPALESAGFPDSVQAFPQQTKLLRARLPGRPLHHRNI